MEQQLDAFTQKRFELMVEMATKKLQQEIDSLKLAFNSLNGELNSMKSQVSRMQFQPQEQPHHASRPAAEEQPAYEEQSASAKKECSSSRSKHITLQDKFQKNSLLMKNRQFQLKKMSRL